VTSMYAARDFLLFVVAALMLAIGSEVSAQKAQPGLTSSGWLGPTLHARAVTARGLLVEPTPELQILARHAAFERDLAVAFGFPVATGSGGSGGLMQDVRLWMAQRWNDSLFDSWAQSALLTYTRIQSSTRFEKSGFNMGVDVDDVAQGKFGIRVSRPLE